jgi:hypothetical protein
MESLQDIKGKKQNTGGKQSMKITPKLGSHDCEIGTMMLSAMVGCQVETKMDDVFCHFHLHFGTITYSTRAAADTLTEEIVQGAWTELLTKAFSDHKIGNELKGLDFKRNDQPEKTIPQA